MKQMISILLAAVSFAGCKKVATEDRVQDSADLVGRWRHTEKYADPGNGSGQWQPMVYVQAAYLDLDSNGTVNASTVAGLSAVDRYTVLNDSTLRFQTSNGLQFDARYSITGQRLELRYPCIEGCGDRFVK